MRTISDFREAMWGVLQQGISTLDVDFVAYAGEHFDRLLAGTHDAGIRAGACARPPATDRRKGEIRWSDTLARCRIAVRSPAIPV